jgi:hypothetical protein
VVCDAGPLIHLDELGVLDLLEDFDTVLVPDAVWNEVQRHRPQATAASFLERVCAPPSVAGKEPSATCWRFSTSFRPDHRSTSTNRCSKK